MRLTFFLFYCFFWGAHMMIHNDAPQDSVSELEKATQKKVEELFYEDQVTSEWSLDDLSKLHSGDAVRAFTEENEKGLLGKSQVFTMRNDCIKQQTIKIFDLLFFTRDFNELFQVASLLKNMMNREQFTYTLAVVLLHRTDINVKIPPWFELFPNYFVRDDVMKQFKEAKDRGIAKLTFEIDHINDDMRYFREDVGLSNSYYNFLLSWPPWLDHSKYNLRKWNRRGEILQYGYTLFGLRTVLERYAANIATTDLKELNESPEIDTKLNLMNSIGEKIVDRELISSKAVSKLESEMPKTWQHLLKTMELYKQIITLPDGSKVNVTEFNGWSVSKVGDIVFNTTESVNPEYYGSISDIIFRHFSGESIDLQEPYNRNAMAYPMSAMRDPFIYKLLLSLNDLLAEHNAAISSYHTETDFSYPGVSIDDVEVGRLETFYDYIEFDVGGSLQDRGKYTLRTKRLNHYPFTIRLNISNSNPEEENTVVRIFIAPNYETSNVTLSYSVFVPLDKFFMKLAPGDNYIERHSTDFPVYVEDKNIIHDNYAQSISKNKVQCGLPDNLMLPKGTPEGLGVIIVVMVSPFSPDSQAQPQHRQFDNFILCGAPPQQLEEDRAFAFPWDKGWNVTDLSNSTSFLYNYIDIYHKE